MKKAIVLILLLCAMRIFSDIHGEVKVGKAIEIDAGFAEITIQYDFAFDNSELILFGSWLTWFQFTDYVILFAPFQDIYSAGVEYKISNMFFSIEHFCNHPVYSGYGVLEDLKRGENLTTIEAGITW